MTNDLVAGFEDWLSGRPIRDLSLFVSHADVFLDWWGDAPVAILSEGDIRAFLLEWCPRHLTMAAEEADAVCGAVGQFLLYLGSIRSLRGGAARGAKLARVATGSADAMRTAMADPANCGMAKSLSAGIDGAGVMSEQELIAAMQVRIDEHNSLPFEQRKALTDRLFEPKQQQIELPFVYGPPPETEVAAASAAAALPTKVQALHDYLGEKGKALTAKGNLKIADGRALVELLDTGDTLDQTIGDKTFKTKSTAELRRLMYLLAVFQEAGAVRYAGNRLIPTKAWSGKSAIIKATKLFETVIGFGVLSMMGSRISFYGELHDLIDDGVVHWLAGLLARDAQARFDDIVELNERVVATEFRGEQIHYYLSRGHLSEDLSRIVEMLDMTGAVTWTGRVESRNEWGTRHWTGGNVALTALGRHTLPKYLPEAGIVLRTAPDLAEATAAELISALDSVPTEEYPSILAGWQPTRPDVERAGLVAGLVTEADDAATRIVGFEVLKTFDMRVAEPHMRQLLDTAAAGHAAMWLLDNGLADGEAVGGFITPAVLVDILSMLLGNPDVLCEQFLNSHDPHGMLDFFWRHPAPETAPVLDTLGQHLADRALAKQARKAAIKHRSWMANS